MNGRTPILAAAISLLVFAPAAGAQVLGTSPQAVFQETAQGLREDPIFVHPDAQSALSEQEQQSLRDRIEAQNADPMYIAVVPELGLTKAQRAEFLGAIANRTRQRGIYALVEGNSLAAGQTDRYLPRGAPRQLAKQAADGAGDANEALTNFVDLVGGLKEGRSGGAPLTGARDNGSGDEGGTGISGLLLLGALGLGGGALLMSRRRRSKAAHAEETTDFEEAKQNGKEDLVALGEDIRLLDIDMELDTTPQAAKDHYARAVELYTKAEEQWEYAKRPEQLEPVGNALEEGRYEMACAKAIMEGRQLPERRPPCFFDPRHGPSVTDVEWSPPYGSPRMVPACHMDAQQLAHGQDPHVREVMVGGQATPYYNAGPAYAPYAGGFFGGFGGGLLPGLLVGSMLGSTIGGMGYAGDAYGSDFGGGDFGGGDFGGGDFGGGDFGGGDFGGGDFGGGGDF